jgi:hypothetical protein
VAVAEWDPELRMALLTKSRGKAVHGMGTTLREGPKGLHLHEEEILFLLERSQIDVPNVNFAQLYGSVDLPVYLVYAYLKSLSLVVRRYEGLQGQRLDTTSQCPFHYTVYGPNQNFSKTNPGTPLFYTRVVRCETDCPSWGQEGCLSDVTSFPLLLLRDRDSCPSASQFQALFQAADNVPVKVTAVSDEGTVVAFGLSLSPLTNLPA